MTIKGRLLAAPDLDKEWARLTDEEKISVIIDQCDQNTSSYFSQYEIVIRADPDALVTYLYWARVDHKGAPELIVQRVGEFIDKWGKDILDGLKEEMGIDIDDEEVIGIDNG